MGPQLPPFRLKEIDFLYRYKEIRFTACKGQTPLAVVLF